MLQVPVVDLNNNVIGNVDLDEKVFGQPENEGACQWWRKEALEAKRLREGPFRVIQVASMGGWRYCIWSSSKRLLLQYAKKEGEACFVQRTFIEAEGK